MQHDNPIAELDDAIAGREAIIKQLLVARALDQAFGQGLEAANAVESRLYAAGYEQTKRGDWFLL